MDKLILLLSIYCVFLKVFMNKFVKNILIERNYFNIKNLIFN